MTWLFVHLGFGVLFMGGILVHMIKAPLSGGWSMWFDRHDWHQLMAGTRYYLGLAHELPKLGKYAVSSKVFHVALFLLALIMIVSGISLSLNTLGWAEVDQNWQRRQRLLHDFGSYGFLVLVVGHVFWQLLKNRSQLMAMVSGRIAADTFSANHDWDRWKPDVLSQTADAGKVDHG
jgi:cytochrome b subunit of formate dehydrogenase